jgi:hypothetical protein
VLGMPQKWRLVVIVGPLGSLVVVEAGMRASVAPWK